MSGLAKRTARRNNGVDYGHHGGRAGAKTLTGQLQGLSGGEPLVVTGTPGNDEFEFKDDKYEVNKIERKHSGSGIIVIDGRSGGSDKVEIKSSYWAGNLPAVYYVGAGNALEVNFKGYKPEEEGHSTAVTVYYHNAKLGEADGNVEELSALPAEVDALLPKSESTGAKHEVYGRAYYNPLAGQGPGVGGGYTFTSSSQRWNAGLGAVAHGQGQAATVFGAGPIKGNTNVLFNASVVNETPPFGGLGDVASRDRQLELLRMQAELGVGRDILSGKLRLSGSAGVESFTVGQVAPVAQSAFGWQAGLGTSSTPTQMRAGWEFDEPRDKSNIYFHTAMRTTVPGSGQTPSSSAAPLGNFKTVQGDLLAFVPIDSSTELMARLQFDQNIATDSEYSGQYHRLEQMPLGQGVWGDGVGYAELAGRHDIDQYLPEIADKLNALVGVSAGRVNVSDQDPTTYLAAQAGVFGEKELRNLRLQGGVNLYMPLNGGVGEERGRPMVGINLTATFGGRNKAAPQKAQATPDFFGRGY